MRNRNTVFILSRQGQTSRRSFLAQAAGFPALSRSTRTRFFQKGVNFTAEWPDFYHSDAVGGRLAELKSMDVNSVALVPYGFSPRTRPEIRFGGRGVAETDESVQKVAAIAHQLGLRVLLKPQIWVRDGFPGDLAYPDPRERATWFAQYLPFLEHYSRLATAIRADLFCIGVEFAHLTPFETEWRQLIARARQLYDGPLTYGATQGPEFEGLAFWDALDYIGLNNYYPMPDSLDASGVVAKVAAVQRRFRKPVIFPEAGFASLQGPNRAPWDETPRALSPEDQARCYEAVFKAFYDLPWFSGMYWWKVGTNGYGGLKDGSHTPWGKPAMDVVRRWYHKERR